MKVDNAAKVTSGLKSKSAVSDSNKAKFKKVLGDAVDELVEDDLLKGGGSSDSEGYEKSDLEKSIAALEEVIDNLNRGNIEDISSEELSQLAYKMSNSGNKKLNEVAVVLATEAARLKVFF